MTKQDLIGRKFIVKATGVTYKFIDDPRADNIQITDNNNNKENKKTEGRQWRVKYVLENLQDTSELRWELLEEHVIEIGDIVEYINPTKYGKHKYTIDSIYGNTLKFTETGHTGSVELYKLVSKANKQEVIGYKLLKDTPEYTKGEVFLKVKNCEEYYKDGDSESHYFYYPNNVENKPEWFEPIYETKPTELLVDTTAGIVRVTAKQLHMNSAVNCAYVNTERFREIKKLISFNRSIDGFNVKVETFKVGCKTFHVNDILKIQEAIKEVS